MKYSKKQLLFAIVLLVFLSQINLIAQTSDNFSDGNLTINPQWKGALSDFMVNEYFQLQLNATIAGNSHIYLHTELNEETEWEFYIKQNFSPSSNNYSRIYLLADDSTLINSQQALYLQFGESGSEDVIELVRQEGDEKTSLIRGVTSISSASSLIVKIRRSSAGLWTLYTKAINTNLFVEEGSAIDPTFYASTIFGIYCKYTKSNRQQFFFDDIYIGPFQIDNTPPRLWSFNLISSDSIQLLFSEPLDTLSILNAHHYSINNGRNYPHKISFDQHWKEIILHFEQPFEQNTSSHLKIRGLRDLAENQIIDTLITFTYYQLDTADIIINEILFDPLIGGEEYVEIYNRSEKFLRLDKLLFFRIKEKFPNPPDTSAVCLTDRQQIIGPGEYWIISRSPEKVIQQYFTENPDQTISCLNLPSLLNDEGILGLLSKNALLIDKIFYSEKMHHPLLNFTDGVSLERIHYDRSGYDNSNWHSSAQLNGFGTPTYKNSQFKDFDETPALFSLSSKTISPNNDGLEDFLTINYSLPENGYITNVIIFDSRGQQLRYLINNEYLGTSGYFVWDGTNDQGQVLPMGIYIIYIELLDLKGDLKKFRKTITLVKQLN